MTFLARKRELALDRYEHLCYNRICSSNLEPNHLNCHKNSPVAVAVFAVFVDFVTISVRMPYLSDKMAQIAQSSVPHLLQLLHFVQYS